MPESTVQAAFGIDIGGTSTRVSATDGATVVRWAGASANPASVGPDDAERHLQAALDAVVRAFPGQESWRGWVAWAAVDGSTIDVLGNQLRAALVGAGLRGSVLVSGDVAPLLYGPPLHGRGLVVVAGTGSCAIARAEGTPVVVGGVEYLLSDQGSGFDLALKALRAAASSADGRGPRTALLTAAEEHFAGSIAEVGRRLAAAPYPKTVVASFASRVLETWQAADAVAGVLVAEAVEDLVLAAAAAVGRAGLRDEVGVVATGGLVLSSERFSGVLAEALRKRFAGSDVRISYTTVESPADVAMAAAPTAHARPDGRLPVLQLEAHDGAA
jgi:N-acetylglucosamine kinase-like BadF-type ATPase